MKRALPPNVAMTALTARAARFSVLTGSNRRCRTLDTTARTAGNELPRMRRDTPYEDADDDLGGHPPWNRIRCDTGDGWTAHERFPRSSTR